MRKILSIFALILVLFCFAGCDSVDPVLYFTFNFKSLNMEVGDSINIYEQNLSTNMFEYAQMHIYSSDDSIAEINGASVIAKNEGISTITVGGLINGNLLTSSFIVNVSKKEIDFNEDNNYNENEDNNGEEVGVDGDDSNISNTDNNNEESNSHEDNNNDTNVDNEFNNDNENHNNNDSNNNGDEDDKSEDNNNENIDNNTNNNENIDNDTNNNENNENENDSSLNIVNYNEIVSYDKIIYNFEVVLNEISYSDFAYEIISGKDFVIDKPKKVVNIFEIKCQLGKEVILKIYTNNNLEILIIKLPYLQK